ncbi:MAG: DUF1648 domain-containing protein [Methylocystaceae bacterium]
MEEKMNRCYPAWLNLLPLIITFFAAIYVIITYDQLPARIASHFDFQGLPDGYGKRNSIILLPIIGGVTTISMTLINIFAIMRPDDPKKVINLDPAQLKALGPAKLEQMRVFSARCLFVITLLVAVMLSYGSWGAVRVGLGLQPGLGIWMMVLAGALFIVSIYMVIKTVGWAFTSPAKKDH